MIDSMTTGLFVSKVFSRGRRAENFKRKLMNRFQEPDFPHYLKNVF